MEVRAVKKKNWKCIKNTLSLTSMNNRDLNIYQRNLDYNFGHNHVNFMFEYFLYILYMVKATLYTDYIEWNMQTHNKQD